MKARPIIFTGPSVPAILAGRKSQTRRLVKWPIVSEEDGGRRRLFHEEDAAVINALLANPGRHPLQRIACPYGRPGDLLWVREGWGTFALGWGAFAHGLIYRADAVCDDSGERNGWWEGERFVGPVTWRSPLHLRRRDARLWLQIDAVRVERVQEISEEDYFAEGLRMPALERTVDGGGGEMVAANWWWKHEFRAAWDLIHGPGAWDRNDWVWVVTFHRVERPAEETA